MNERKADNAVQSPPKEGPDRGLKKIKKLYYAALENGLDAAQLIKIANRNTKSDVTYEDKDIAEEIVWEMKGMTNEAKIDLLTIYQKRKILTEGVATQFNKLLEEQERINVQQQGFGVLQDEDKE
jgi:hypothetical protein